MIWDRAKELVLRQWQAIDDEYREREPFDGRAMAVLVTAAVVLVFNRFWGKPSTLTDIPGVTRALSALPYRSLYPWLWRSGFKIVGYGVLPAQIIKLVLKERIRDYGIVVPLKSPEMRRRIRILYASLCAFVVPLAYVASLTKPFLATYPKYGDAGGSLTQFFAWELAYALQFFMLEFFFRGFLLFSLARYIGPLAIYVMVVPYAMLHFDKPLVEALGSILTGIVLGTLALRTRSIYGGTIVHVGVAVSMDVFALLQKGALHRLFGH